MPRAFARVSFSRYHIYPSQHQRVYIDHYDSPHDDRELLRHRNSKHDIHIGLRLVPAEHASARLERRSLQRLLLRDRTAALAAGQRDERAIC